MPNCVACWADMKTEASAGYCSECRKDGEAMRAGDDLIRKGECILRDASVRLTERRAKHKKESN